MARLGEMATASAQSGFVGSRHLSIRVSGPGPGRDGSVCGVAAGEDKSRKKSESGLSQLVKAESFLQFAIALPAGCVIGWLVGAALDKHFHQHWIGVVGILLGAAAGFIQIFTMASRYLKRDD